MTAAAPVERRVDTLRRAAALIRDRATAAEAMLASPWTVGPWGEAGGDSRDGYAIAYAIDNPLAGLVATCADYVPLDAADHIASWHPAVALAAADMLEEFALLDDKRGIIAPTSVVTLAKRYLGDPS